MSKENERGEKQFHERQNSLTEGDLEMIRTIIMSLQYNWEHNLPVPEPHVCRFSDDITPEDFRDMVITHKEIKEIIKDSKTVVRRTLIGIAIIFFMGMVSKGFWVTLWEKLK